MHGLLIAFRLLHIVLGALWVGMACFAAFYLTPAVADAGPDGGKVMGALQKRGLMTVMPILAVITILSGFWLYWQASGGFQPAWSASRPGMAYGIGGAASLMAFAIGVTILRPSMARAATLAQTLGTLPLAQQADRLAEVQRLRNRGVKAGQVTAYLLLFAVAAMAVARYL